MAPEDVGVKLVALDYITFMDQLREAQRLSKELNGQRVIIHFESKGLERLRKELQGLGSLVQKANRGAIASALNVAAGGTGDTKAAAAQARAATSEFEKLQAIQRRNLEMTLKASRTPPDVISEQLFIQSMRHIDERMAREKTMTDDLRMEYADRRSSLKEAYRQEQDLLRQRQNAPAPEPTVKRDRLNALERDIRAQQNVIYRSEEQFQNKLNSFTDRFERARTGSSGEDIRRVADLKQQWQDEAEKGLVRTGIQAIENDVASAGIRVGRTFEVFEDLENAKKKFDTEATRVAGLPGATEADRVAIGKLADRRAQIFDEETARAEKQIGNRIRQESFEKSFMGQLASAESRTYGARILASELQRAGMSSFIGGVGVALFAQKQAESYLTEFRQPIGRVQRALDLSASERDFLDTTLLDRAGRESLVPATDAADAMRVWSEAINTVVDSEKDLYDATSQTGLVIQTEMITNLVKLNEGTATLDQTVSDTAAILTQFGMVSEDSAKQTESLVQVVALLDTAAASGLANVNDIGSSLKFFAGRAHDLGVALPEAVASIEMLAQVGLKGSQSGRGMDQLIKSLVAPTPKAQDAFAKILGEGWKGAFFDLNDPKQPFKGLANFLKEMADATEDMTVMQRQEEFAALGDANAIRTLNALILRTIEARRLGREMGYGEVDYLKTLTQLREQGSAGLEKELEVLTKLSGIDFGDLSAIDSYKERIEILRASIETLYSQSINRLEASFLQLGKSMATTVVPALDDIATIMSKIADIVDQNPWMTEMVIKGAGLAIVGGAGAMALSGVTRTLVNVQTLKMAAAGAGGMGAIAASLMGKTGVGLAGLNEAQVATGVLAGRLTGGGVLAKVHEEALSLGTKLAGRALKEAEILAIMSIPAAAKISQKAVRDSLAFAAHQTAGKAAAAAAEAAYDISWKAYREGTGPPPPPPPMPPTGGIERGTRAAVGTVAEVGVKAATISAVTGLAKAMLSLPVFITGLIQKGITGLAEENAKFYIAQQKTDAGRTVAAVMRAPDLARVPGGASPLGPLGGVMQLTTAAEQFAYNTFRSLGITEIAGMKVPEEAPTKEDWKAWALESAQKEGIGAQALATYQYFKYAMGNIPDKIGEWLTKIPALEPLLARGSMAADEMDSPSWTRTFKALWALLPFTNQDKYREKRIEMDTGVDSITRARYFEASRQNMLMQYNRETDPQRTAAEWEAVFSDMAADAFYSLPAQEDIDKVVKDFFSESLDAAAAMTQAGVPAEEVSKYLSDAAGYMADLQSGSGTLYSNMLGLVTSADLFSRSLDDSAVQLTAMAELMSGRMVNEAKVDKTIKPAEAFQLQEDYLKQAATLRDNLVKEGVSQQEADQLFNQVATNIDVGVAQLFRDKAAEAMQLIPWATQLGMDPEAVAAAAKIPEVGRYIVLAVLDQALAALQQVAGTVATGKELTKKAEAAREDLAKAAMTPDQRSIKGFQDQRDAALYGLTPGTEPYIQVQKNYAAAIGQVGSAAKKATMSLQDVATKWRGMIESALDISKGLAVTDKQWNQTLGMQGGPPEDQGDSNKAKMWSALSAAIGPYVDTAWEPLRRLASAANDPQTKWAGLLPGGVSPGTPQAQAYFSFVQDRVNAFDPAFSQFFPDKKKLLEGIVGDLEGQSRKESFITDVVAEGKLMGLDEEKLRKYFEDPQAELDKTMGILDGSIIVASTATDNLKDSMDKTKVAVEDSIAATQNLTLVMEKFIPPTKPPDDSVPPPPTPPNPDPNAGKLGGEKFARGGLVTKPTYALIGEAGPELIIPLGRSGGFTGRGFVAPTPIMLQSISPQIGQLNLNTTVNGAPSQLARNLVHTQKAAARNLGFEILRLAAREGA